MNRWWWWWWHVCVSSWLINFILDSIATCPASFSMSEYSEWILRVFHVLLISFLLSSSFSFSFHYILFVLFGMPSLLLIVCILVCLFVYFLYLILYLSCTLCWYARIRTLCERIISPVKRKESGEGSFYPCFYRMILCGHLNTIRHAECRKSENKQYRCRIDDAKETCAAITTHTLYGTVRWGKRLIHRHYSGCSLVE